jgi:MinD superfamily P-loop ATPase
MSKNKCTIAVERLPRYCFESGVDRMLLVTEPFASGISNMERIIKTVQKLLTPAAIYVNKYDTNLKKTQVKQNNFVPSANCRLF